MLVVVVYLILLVPRTYEWIVRSPNRLSISGIICSHGDKTQVNCVTSHADGHISPQQQAGHDGIITIKSDALSSGFHRSAMHMGRAPHAASLIMIIIICNNETHRSSHLNLTSTETSNSDHPLHLEQPRFIAYQTCATSSSCSTCLCDYCSKAWANVPWLW